DPLTVAATAGTPTAITLTAIAATGGTAPGFRGTIHLTSTDPIADLPADLTFTASDAGVKHTMVTFKTAGERVLTATDTPPGGVRGVAVLSIGGAAATTCVTSQAPIATVAGSVFGITVGLRDIFGNAATGYTGTIRLTASDPRALLPPDVTFATA